MACADEILRREYEAKRAHNRMLKQQELERQQANDPEFQAAKRAKEAAERKEAEEREASHARGAVSPQGDPKALAGDGGGGGGGGGGGSPTITVTVASPPPGRNERGHRTPAIIPRSMHRGGGGEDSEPEEDEAAMLAKMANRNRPAQTLAPGPKTRSRGIAPVSRRRDSWRPRGSVSAAAAAQDEGEDEDAALGTMSSRLQPVEDDDDPNFNEAEAARLLEEFLLAHEKKEADKRAREKHRRAHRLARREKKAQDERNRWLAMKGLQEGPDGTLVPAPVSLTVTAPPKMGRRRSSLMANNLRSRKRRAVMTDEELFALAEDESSSESDELSEAAVSETDELLSSAVEYEEGFSSESDIEGVIDSQIQYLQTHDHPCPEMVFGFGNINTEGFDIADVRDSDEMEKWASLLFRLKTLQRGQEHHKELFALMLEYQTRKQIYDKDQKEGEAEERRRMRAEEVERDAYLAAERAAHMAAFAAWEKHRQDHLVQSKKTKGAVSKALLMSKTNTDKALRLHTHGEGFQLVDVDAGKTREYVAAQRAREATLLFFDESEHESGAEAVDEDKAREEAKRKAEALAEAQRRAESEAWEKEEMALMFQADKERKAYMQRVLQAKTSALVDDVSDTDSDADAKDAKADGKGPGTKGKKGQGRKQDGKARPKADAGAAASVPAKALRSKKMFVRAVGNIITHAVRVSKHMTDKKSEIQSAFVVDKVEVNGLKEQERAQRESDMIEMLLQQKLTRNASQLRDELVFKRKVRKVLKVFTNKEYRITTVMRKRSVRFQGMVDEMRRQEEADKALDDKMRKEKERRARVLQAQKAREEAQLRLAEEEKKRAEAKARSDKLARHKHLLKMKHERKGTTRWCKRFVTKTLMTDVWLVCWEKEQVRLVDAKAARKAETRRQLEETLMAAADDERKQFYARERERKDRIRMAQQQVEDEKRRKVEREEQLLMYAEDLCMLENIAMAKADADSLRNMQREAKRKKMWAAEYERKLAEEQAEERRLAAMTAKMQERQQEKVEQRLMAKMDRRRQRYYDELKNLHLEHEELRLMECELMEMAEQESDVFNKERAAAEKAAAKAARIKAREDEKQRIAAERLKKQKAAAAAFLKMKAAEEAAAAKEAAKEEKRLAAEAAQAAKQEAEDRAKMDKAAKRRLADELKKEKALEAMDAAKRKKHEAAEARALASKEREAARAAKQAAKIADMDVKVKARMDKQKEQEKAKKAAERKHAAERKQQAAKNRLERLEREADKLSKKNAKAAGRKAKMKERKSAAAIAMDKAHVEAAQTFQEAAVDLAEQGKDNRVHIQKMERLLSTIEDTVRARVVGLRCCARTR